MIRLCKVCVGTTSNSHIYLYQNQFAKPTGCYETYLRTKIFDTVSAVGKTKIEKACEWLGFWDQLDAGMWKKGHHELGAYLPYPIVSFHGLFASARRVEIEFPRVQHEVALFEANVREGQNVLRCFDGLDDHEDNC